MSTNSGQSEGFAVPGQAVLPTMVEEVGYETIVLRPKDEKFCWEYVLNANSNGKRAYMTSHPNASERTAEVEASKCLRKPEIAARIAQIRSEVGRQMMATVMNYHRKVMEVDRNLYLDKNGDCKKIAEMGEEERSILEFDQVVSKGEVLTLLKVPTRHQSAVEIQKIMGMNKETPLFPDTLNVKHTGAVGVTDDMNKLEALRSKFGMKRNDDGSADTAG